MAAYQAIPTQPNRLLTPSVAGETQLDNNGNQIVTFASVANDSVAIKGIDAAQTETARNFPDHRANLALVAAYLIAATNRDYTPLHALKNTIGMPGSVRTASGHVRPSLQRLARLRQIRLYAMGWKRLVRSDQEDDPRIAQAFFTCAKLLQEVMKPS